MVGDGFGPGRGVGLGRGPYWGRGGGGGGLRGCLLWGPGLVFGGGAAGHHDGVDLVEEQRRGRVLPRRLRGEGGDDGAQFYI